MNLNTTILGQSISFIFFVWFCMKYVWNPLISIIEKRQKEISDNLASVKKAKTEYNLIKLKANDYLKEMKKKGQEIIEQANKYKEQIINEAKEEAEKERLNILNQAEQQIMFKRKRVTEELQKQLGQLVCECTEKVIGHTIDRSMNDKFINNIVDTL